MIYAVIDHAEPPSARRSRRFPARGCITNPGAGQASRDRPFHQCHLCSRPLRAPRLCETFFDPRR